MAAIPGVSTALPGADTTTLLSTDPVASSIPATTSVPALTTTSPSAVLPSTTPSSILPSTTPTTSLLPSTTAAPSSSTTTAAPPTTTSTSTSTVPTSTRPSTTLVVTKTTTGTAPGLVTGVTASSRTTSAKASGTAAAANSKGGIGGSGLSIGALVGIIIGSIAGLILIALLITRTMRKRARAKRTKLHRSSLFEPYPTVPQVDMHDDDELEKAAAASPAQSYPMTAQYPSAYPPAGAPQDYVEYNVAGAGAGQYAPVPTQAGDYYGVAGMGAGAAGLGAAIQPEQHQEMDMGMAAGGQMPHEGGLHDAMMVRVKVGFVRSLEDELAVAPGQQLYLHTAYDDGWSLCEDAHQNRGVVPVSCLEPWVDEHQYQQQQQQQGGGLLPRSETGLSARSERRSSLYQRPTSGYGGQ